MSDVATLRASFVKFCPVPRADKRWQCSYGMAVMLCLVEMIGFMPTHFVNAFRIYFLNKLQPGDGQFAVLGRLLWALVTIPLRRFGMLLVTIPATLLGLMKWVPTDWVVKEIQS